MRNDRFFTQEMEFGFQELFIFKGQETLYSKRRLVLCIGILWRSTNSVQRGLLNFPIQLDGGFLGHDFRRFCINLFHPAQTFN